MPNFYAPYNFFPATYSPQPMSYAPTPMPQQQMQPQQPSMKAMEWVEGEVGAKAFQMPQGWPANTPIPLWDSTDTVIYLKSWNQMGIPNQMQRLKYEIPQTQQPLLQNGQGDQSGQTHPEYVTKQDLERMMDEMKKEMRGAVSATAAPVQNGSNANRGGNR